MAEKQEKPKNEVVGKVQVDVERCHPQTMYMWSQFATTKLDDGTPVTIGTVLPSGGLYLFVKPEGQPVERYHINQMALSQKVLAVIEDLRKPMEGELVDAEFFEEGPDAPTPDKAAG